MVRRDAGVHGGKAFLLGARPSRDPRRSHAKPAGDVDMAAGVQEKTHTLLFDEEPKSLREGMSSERSLLHSPP